MSEPPPEFSQPVDLASLPKKGGAFELAANEEERAAIARRFEIPAVNELTGKMRVSASLEQIDVKGSLKARLIRECVASLEEMDEDIDETFEIAFLRREPEVKPDDDEDWLSLPDVHENPVLDIGELLVQQLSLAMAAFPRKADAPSLADQYGEEEELSPLAAALAQARKLEENQ